MLADAGQELVEAAQAVIRARYRVGWHAVGCALRSGSGLIHLGVHLECDIGRVTVCAEAIAIGRAVTDGDGRLDTIVAVYQTSAADEAPPVVAPCGMCREMISDYSPSCRVIVPGSDGPTILPIASLLPGKFVRPGS